MKNARFLCALLLSIACSTSLAQKEKNQIPAQTESSQATMESAYKRLLGQIDTGEEKIALEAMQHAWLKDRDEICVSKGDVCLVRMNTQRRYLLEGRTIEGSKSLAPVRLYSTYQAGDKAKAELSATRIKFTAPRTAAQAAFNRFMDKQLEWAVGTIKGATPANGEEYFSSMVSELNYASDGLLSASVGGSYFVGQFHPEPWGRSINLDARTGRTFRFGDLMQAGNANRLFAMCLKQVNEKKSKLWKDPKSADVTFQAVAQSTADLGNWKFLSQGAMVEYSLYDFGGYGQCNCSCDVPYAALRPLAKKSFPLPSEK